MNRDKGIVVDVTDTHIVLMSVSDGTFKNIPRPPDYVPLLGEEMEIAQITKRKLTLWTKFASVACMVLLLFSAMVLFTQKKSEEAYMVALDINPSLELYTDSRLRVTRVIARNRDGERVLRQVEYKDKPLRDVMKLVIDNCVDMDYLKPDRKKTIRSTLIPLLDAPPIQETEVKEMIFQPLQERKINADVEVTTGDAKMIKVSEKLDISVNKVKLYEQLQEQHVPITVEDVQNTPIDKLQQQSEMSRDKQADRTTRQSDSGSGHTVREADGKTTTKGSETRVIDSHNSVKSVNREPDVGGSNKSAPVHGEADAINPNPDGAETAEPDTVEMKPEEPDTGRLETTKSDPAGTDMSGKGEALTKESDAADPGNNVVESANPDPVKPEMAKPDTVETKQEVPDTGGMETAEPDSTVTDMSGKEEKAPTDPGSKETEAVVPNEVGLETAEPDSAQEDAS